MPFWKGKTKTYIDAFVSPLFTNKGPSLMDDVVANSILGGNDFVDELLERTVHSPFNRFERFYRYGRDKYVRGLPTVTVSNNNIGTSSIVPAIQADTGRTVQLEYVKLGAYHPAHYVWKLLVSTYGYDHDTNRLNAITTETGSPAYLHGIEIKMPTTVDQAFYWAEEIRLRTPAREVPELSPFEMIFTNQEIPTPVVSIEYAYTDQNGGGTVDEVTVPIPEAFRDDTYYMAHYTYTENGVTKHDYWEYLPGDGTHPSLDDVTQLNVQYINIGDFYPTGLFISRNRNLAADTSTETFKSSSELFDQIGLDYGDLAAEIQKNDDVDKIQQAALQLGVPITSQDPLGMTYLFEFFDGIYEKVSSDDLKGIDDSIYDNSGKYRITFKEGADYEFTLVFGDIYRGTKAGSIGPVGTHTNTHKELSYSKLKEEIRVGPHGRQRVTTVKKTYKFPVRIFQRQASEGVYEEVIVVKPSIAFQVTGSKAEWADLKDDRLLVPLDRSIVLRLRPVDRDYLMRLSLHMVFTAKEKQHIKWYQTKTFGWILVIAAVAITIATGGTTYQALVTAWQAGTAAFALAVLKLLLVIALTQIGLREIGKRVSPELALVLAVVAFALGVTTDGVAFLSADQLMLMSSNLVQVSQYGSAYQIEQIQHDMEELKQLEEERKEKLIKAREALDDPLNLDPMHFVGLQPMIMLNESPESFYQRTVHTGNIGTLAFDYLHTYVDESLKLPGVSTLEGIDYNFT